LTPARLYRDDGPPALALGATLGRALPVPALALLVAGALPLAVAVALGSARSADGTAAGIVAWLVLLGGASSGRPHEDRLSWLAPPLIRACEYAAIIWLAALAGAQDEGAAFALLGALAFRHYDLVYRLRGRGAAPPGWLNRLALGWDGRLIVVCALAIAGALPTALYVLAACLAALFVTESVRAWTRPGREQRPMPYDDEEDEGQ
jgi:hypothetical protein